MTEPKSECHGADVYWDWDTDDAYTRADKSKAKIWRCSQCHKPTTVRREEKDV